MQYKSLGAEDLASIRAERLRELEVNHYRLTLEEAEEPGFSNQRRRAITDIERRIAKHCEALGITENMAGDSPERDDDEVAQP